MKTHVRAHTRQVSLSAVDARLKRLEKRLPTIPALPLGEANDLPVQVSIIVPSTTENNRHLTEEEFQNRVDDEKKWMDTQFGGDTTIKDVGSYMMDGELIQEPGAIVEASMSRGKYNKLKNAIAAHAMKKREEWSQDTILLRVENRAFIVPKKDYIDNDKKMPKRILVT